jgi:hypothetical protein
MTLLDDVSCARIPQTELACLAGLRGEPGVEVAIDGGSAWVHWGPGHDEVLHQVFAISGASLYEFRNGHWFEPGKRLPKIDFPAGLSFRPLDQVLFPDRVEPTPPPVLQLHSVELRLVQDHQPRPTTLVECRLADLQAWTDGVPTIRLESLQAAWHGERVLLLGSRLPLFSKNQRFWGESLFWPLGYRLEPCLPDKAVREALEISEQEYLVFQHDGMEAIPEASFGPLNRAAIRQAILLTGSDRRGRVE